MSHNPQYNETFSMTPHMCKRRVAYQVDDRNCGGAFGVGSVIFIG